MNIGITKKKGQMEKQNIKRWKKKPNKTGNYINSNPQIQQSGHKFYPRVKNLTNIQFNQ